MGKKKGKQAADQPQAGLISTLRPRNNNVLISQLEENFEGLLVFPLSFQEMKLADGQRVLGIKNPKFKLINGCDVQEILKQNNQDIWKCFPFQKPVFGQIENKEGTYILPMTEFYENAFRGEDKGHVATMKNMVTTFSDTYAEENTFRKEVAQIYLDAYFEHLRQYINDPNPDKTSPPQILLDDFLTYNNDNASVVCDHFNVFISKNNPVRAFKLDGEKIAYITTPSYEKIIAEELQELKTEVLKFLNKTCFIHNLSGWSAELTEESTRLTSDNHLNAIKDAREERARKAAFHFDKDQIKTALAQNLELIERYQNIKTQYKEKGYEFVVLLPLEMMGNHRTTLKNALNKEMKMEGDKVAVTTLETHLDIFSIMSSDEMSALFSDRPLDMVNTDVSIVHPEPDDDNKLAFTEESKKEFEDFVSFVDSTGKALRYLNATWSVYSAKITEAENNLEEEVNSNNNNNNNNQGSSSKETVKKLKRFTVSTEQGSSIAPGNSKKLQQKKDQT